jgi:chaperone required for assembly of F1-ATPase
MYLELHDNEVGNSLSAQINNIDYDYQAEQWVQETYNNPDVKCQIIK